ncbi:hypothetical protein LJC61_01345 [Ruminococcaceae bacterium OttesenSCG-928-A16]|nr:hypothetical protein [Ruminococcaceae bacterium OttesenSCG-928-A16]
MWPYDKVTRIEFEERKDFVEAVFKQLGAKETNFGRPSHITSIIENNKEEFTSNRIVFEYQGCYYRVCEVLFAEKPFIVIEFANRLDDVKNNCMEDLDPFPYDLAEDCVVEEIKNQMSS